VGPRVGGAGESCCGDVVDVEIGKAKGVSKGEKILLRYILLFCHAHACCQSQAFALIFRS
jgi:hypothetical protein